MTLRLEEEETEVEELYGPEKEAPSMNSLQAWHRWQLIEKHRKDVPLMANGSTKAYQVIADRIIEALDKGIVPWRKPWSLPAGIRPQNVQGRPYSGINSIVLGLAPYSDPRWLTFRKAIELGGHIRKGEKSTPIVFWKFLDVERENQNGEVVEKTIPLLRY